MRCALDSGGRNEGGLAPSPSFEGFYSIFFLNFGFDLVFPRLFCLVKIMALFLCFKIGIFSFNARSAAGSFYKFHGNLGNLRHRRMLAFFFSVCTKNIGNFLNLIDN